MGAPIVTSVDRVPVLQSAEHVMAALPQDAVPAFDSALETVRPSSFAKKPETWENVHGIWDGRSVSNIRAKPVRFAFAGLITYGHCGCALAAQMQR